MPKKSIKKIIYKYLASESSEAEDQQLLIWLEKNENQIIFKNYLNSKLFLDMKYKSFRSEEAITLFLNQIKVIQDPILNNKPVFIEWLKYAAIFIGLLTATVYIINWNDQKDLVQQFSILETSGIILKIDGSKGVDIFKINGGKVLKNKNGKEIGIIKNNILTHSNNLGNKNEMASTNILSVPYGKQFNIILADGTSVRLNAGSLLKYPSNFNGKYNREVYLEGEAYFTVAKDKNIPFIVKTKKLDTKVYGTEFNVSAYINDEISEVVLVEGAVGVKESINKTGSTNKYIIIKPSQKASIEKTINGVKIKDVNVNSYVAWKSGALIFNNDNIAVAFKKLERKFNIQIQNNYSELYKHSYTGAFNSENLDEILTIMSTHTNFNYKKEGKKIIIINHK